MNKPDCEPVKIPNNFEIKTWLEKQASKYKLNYLLAHADDGVIWGRFQNGNLITADSVFPQFAKLRKSTLQQCRIFDKTAEIMLWKIKDGENRFKARCIKDEHLKTEDYICENQILWGTHGEKREYFTLLQDGKQGLNHAVPFTDIEIETEGKLRHPVRLQVRHYIDYDDAGVARIYLSRLVNLIAKDMEKEIKK